MRLAKAIREYCDDMYKRTELVKGKVTVRRIPFYGSLQGWVETFLDQAITRYASRYDLADGWGKVGYLIDNDLEAATMRSASMTFIKRGRDKKSDPEFDYITIPPDLVIEFMNQPYIKEFDYPLPPELDNENSDNYWPQKLDDYQRFGVGLLWIVDLTKEVVHQYRQPEWKSITLQGDDVLDTAPVIPGFRLTVNELFDLEVLEQKARFDWYREPDLEDLEDAPKSL